jgi:hypothetical protein
VSAERSRFLEHGEKTEWGVFGGGREKDWTISTHPTVRFGRPSSRIEA